MFEGENVGGADETTSGAGENETTSGQSTSGNAQTVSKDDHDRALRDMHKFKQAARDAESKLAQMQSQIDDLKAAGLKQKDDYKGLYEATKQKLDEQIEQNNRLKENVLYSERYRAALPALQKAGLSAEASKLVEYADLSVLEVEPRNGRFEVSGVDLFVENFKLEHPYAFRSNKPANVNAGGTNPPTTRGTEPMTPAKLFELEKQCKAKGDMAPYKAAYQAYLVQRNSGAPG
jgi:hypothetical protein